MAKRGAAAAAVETDDEASQLRAELNALKGRLSSTESALQDERTRRTDLELRSMSETERRLLSDEQACDTNIDAWSKSVESLTDELANLYDEPGHGKEIAAKQREMAQLEAKLLREQDKKAYIANQREQAKTNTQTRTRQASVDQAEVLADGRNISQFPPATQKWFKDHPESFTDPAFLKRAVAAAIAATDLEGIEANTPEYFDYVDQKLGIRGRAEPADQGEDLGVDDDSPYSQPAETRQPAARRAAPAAGEDLDYRVDEPQRPAAGRGAMAAAAPPSRSRPAGAASGRRVIAQLSAQQREVADDLWPELDPKERYEKYAADRQAMTRRFPNRFTNATQH